MDLVTFGARSAAVRRLRLLEDSGGGDGDAFLVGDGDLLAARDDCCAGEGDPLDGEGEDPLTESALVTAFAPALFGHVFAISSAFGVLGFVGV